MNGIGRSHDMKPVGIITDSNSGISQADAEKMDIKVLPMPFYFGEECYYENVSLTRDDFFARQGNGENVSTSQPSPESVMNIWREGLAEYDEIIYMPMSSGLSGSCDTAKMLANEDEFAGKVYVVDNGRVSTPAIRALMDAKEMVKEGYKAADIRNMLEAAKEDMSIYIAVETLEFLKKGGRITPATAALGTVLNIKPILSLGVENLDTFAKCRGMKKARTIMLEAIKNDIETKYKSFLEKNELYMLAASSADEETTREWVEEIKEFFPGMEVLSGNLALSICCHTGPGALGVGFSCKPSRI